MSEKGFSVEEIVLASWEDRFWAWLIDVLLMGLFWQSIVFVLDMNAIGLDGVLLLLAMLFIYWTVLEGYRGQSFGKMLQNIAIVGTYGESIQFTDAAIQSIGKAFLLPLDCLIGWSAYREKRQRLFNRLSDTIVIKADAAGCCPI